MQYVVLTNSGGMTEDAKAKQLSKIIDEQAVPHPLRNFFVFLVF